VELLSGIFMTRLVLFDIDETMVHSDGVGRRALEAALKQVFDDSIDSSACPMSGKTDPQICYEIASSAGYSQSEIEERLPATFELYVRLLEKEIEKTDSLRIHKGVVELLDQLSLHPDCHLGLLTGNIEAGARLKLKPFDLNPYFAFGAFGSDSSDRMDLPRLAHRRARQVFARDFERRELVIIGDAVNDVLCARGYGVKCIITATGKTPKETLARLNPDFLFDSLADTFTVLEAILS
jgi:phosphoglycolate phosphatase